MLKNFKHIIEKGIKKMNEDNVVFEREFDTKKREIEHVKKEMKEWSNQRKFIRNK